jgi:hypothetical protein
MNHYSQNHPFKANEEYTIPYHEMAYNYTTKKSLEKKTKYNQNVLFGCSVVL